MSNDPKPFYALCTRGTKAKSLRLGRECQTLEIARIDRTKETRPSAIYKFTFAVKPEFIEGDNITGSAK